MEENTKERIREILDELLNFQDKELNEKDIFELSEIKKELKETKINIEKNIQSKSDAGISENDNSIRELKGNLTRIQLALENISYIISESVIILSENEENNQGDEYDEIENNNSDDDLEEFSSKIVEENEKIESKIEKRKQIKDPLEAFFISYSSANELMKKIKKELKENNKNN